MIKYIKCLHLCLHIQHLRLTPACKHTVLRRCVFGHINLYRFNLHTSHNTYNGEQYKQKYRQQHIFKHIRQKYRQQHIQTNSVSFVRCTQEEFFRYEGTHCTERVMTWELAVIICASAFGALVLVLLFIIIVMCCRNASNSADV